MKKIISIILLFVVFGIVKTQASIVLYMVDAKPGDGVDYTSFTCMPNGDPTAWLVCAGSGSIHCLTLDEAAQQCPGAAIVFFDPGNVVNRVQTIIGDFAGPAQVTSGNHSETYYNVVTQQTQVVVYSWAPAPVAEQDGIRLQIDVVTEPPVVIE